MISLVEDQVYALRNLNVDARALNASTPRSEQTEIMHILDGKVKDDSSLKILYLTPGKRSYSATKISSNMLSKRKLQKVKPLCQNYKSSMKQNDLQD